MRALITGGNGYFGRLLMAELVRQGIECVSLDVCEGPPVPGVEFILGDACDFDHLMEATRKGPVDLVFHLASQIDFASASGKTLYQNNVQSTQSVCRFAQKTHVTKVIFTSSNSVYLGNRANRPILEADPPIPIDDYGRSKIESERTLASFANDFDSVSIRCPNIMDAGRLGMLTILFDFIREGRRCWVIGKGDVRHQCIYAGDLIEASIKAIVYPRSDIFNIGSDNVPTFREMYGHVIDHAGTSAHVASMPSALALPGMKLAHFLGLSPLGAYQYRMLTANFMFDTQKIKRELGWTPTLSNSDVLLKAYQHYCEHRDEILKGQGLSANQRALTKTGIIKLLKLLS